MDVKRQRKKEQFKPFPQPSKQRKPHLGQRKTKKGDSATCKNCAVLASDIVSSRQEFVQHAKFDLFGTTLMVK